MGYYNGLSLLSLCSVVDDLCGVTTCICIRYVYLFSIWQTIILLDRSTKFASHANGT